MLLCGCASTSSADEERITSDFSQVKHKRASSTCPAGCCGSSVFLSGARSSPKDSPERLGYPNTSLASVCFAPAVRQGAFSAMLPRPALHSFGELSPVLRPVRKAKEFEPCAGHFCRLPGRPAGATRGPPRDHSIGPRSPCVPGGNRSSERLRLRGNAYGTPARVSSAQSKRSTP